MINRLIELSLKNRGLILLAYALLAVWGYSALLRTPIDAIPELSENQVIVYTDWAGRSPQEVEDEITYPLTVNLQGVAEVASIGGWVRQYQIDVDPIKLRAYNIPLRTIIDSVQRSNSNVGAKVIEASDQEMAMRGIGLIRSTADIENIVLTATAGTP